MVGMLVPLTGGVGYVANRPSPNWQVLYHLYTTYSPCRTWGVICYRSHLLGEPETTIDNDDVYSKYIVTQLNQLYPTPPPPFMYLLSLQLVSLPIRGGWLLEFLLTKAL